MRWLQGKLGPYVDTFLTALILAEVEGTMPDEEGNRIERVVPKQAFRKHVLLFFFNNESDDTELDWMQYGLPFMLAACSVLSYLPPPSRSRPELCENGDRDPLSGGAQNALRLCNLHETRKNTSH